MLLLWDGKVPQIPLTTLTRMTFERGIALPNLCLYTWATQLVVINYWSFTAQRNAFLMAERHAMDPGDYISELYSNGKLTEIPS